MKTHEERGCWRRRRASAARGPAREARGFRAVSDVPASDASDDSDDSDDSSSSGDDDEDDSSGSSDSSSGESDSEVSGSGSESVSDPPHAKVLLRAPAAYDSDSFEHDGRSVPEPGGDEDESDGGDGGGEASDDSLRSLRSGSTSGDEEEALGDAGANSERRTEEALPKARETRPAPSPRVFGRRAPASRGVDGSKASSARTSAADRNPASTSNEAKAKLLLMPDTPLDLTLTMTLPETLNPSDLHGGDGHELVCTKVISWGVHYHHFHYSQ